MIVQDKIIKSYEYVFFLFILVKNLNCKNLNWIIDQKQDEAKGSREDYSKTPLNSKLGKTSNCTYKRSYKVYLHHMNSLMLIKINCSSNEK